MAQHFKIVPSKDALVSFFLLAIEENGIKGSRLGEVLSKDRMIEMLTEEGIFGGHNPEMVKLDQAVSARVLVPEFKFASA
ncbi:uncharacterized protein JCM15063_004630 [Sporobolomyces koalae]|uniref:uncharacterized protein n=1 Tax=Sporobolomyces koalae TaxID=500713 RepID=UPI0031798BE7